VTLGLFHARAGRMRHMFILPDAKIDRIVAHWRRYLLCGLAVIAVVLLLPRGLRSGIFSGFMLFSLGIYGMAFRRWRSEPGVWMLAAFLGVTLGPGSAYFEFLHWQSVFAKNPNWFTWDEIRVSVDAIIALYLLLECVKLAISVAIRNWQYTHPKKTLPISLTPPAK
jgi:hypothetical protein